MGNSTTFVNLDKGDNADKAFKTELTDYSRRHNDNSGPYADGLDVDAIIVGAGFSKRSCNQMVLQSLSDQCTDSDMPQVGSLCSKPCENAVSRHSSLKLAQTWAEPGDSTVIRGPG